MHKYTLLLIIAFALTTYALERGPIESPDLIDSLVADVNDGNNPPLEADTEIETEVESSRRRRRRGFHLHHRHHRHHVHVPHLHHRHHRHHVHAPHRHHTHVPHRHHTHVPHRHHIHVPHVHVPHIHISPLDAAISLLGSGFKKLYDMFTGLFGGKFSLPKVKLGGSIIQGFKNGVDKIRDSIENVMKEKKGEMLLQTGQEFMPLVPGAYGLIKRGESAFKPIVTLFCTAIKFLTDPILKAFNSVMQLVTGIVPVWLVKVIAFGGLGALLHSFLFKAFTVGGTFTISNQMSGHTAVNTFEAGFSLELNDNLQIGKTGCYLAGSSGIGGLPSIKPISGEVGMAISTFKQESNIAGESATVAGEVDLCTILQLPCAAKLGGGFIFDNSDGNMEAMWNSCKKIFGLGEEDNMLQYGHSEALELVDIGGKKTGKIFTMEAIQTMSKEELKANILEAAKKFFENGFKNIKNCLTTVFGQWIGITMDVDVGDGKEVTPTDGSYTWDYTTAFSADVGKW